MSETMRYAISGLGRRSNTTYLPYFGGARAGRHHLVAAVDADGPVLDELNRRWPSPIATYHATDLNRLLESGTIDWLIVAAPDHCHHAQILSALERGVSVITEKPMVLDTDQALEVLAAVRRSKAALRVAHNFRFLNLHAAIKQLLRQNAIGPILDLRFNYHLLPGHGGSYFLRWHRQRAASGGLAITKSCHHFDLINWWLEDVPVEVSGSTGRRFFHPGNPFPDGGDSRVPLDADIEDTVSATIGYRHGVTVTYALNACSTWEGYALEIRGASGTLTTTYDRHAQGQHRIDVVTDGGRSRSVDVTRECGRHSGADQRMLAVLFNHQSIHGPSSLPDSTAGAMAVAIGDAVFRSSQGGCPIQVCDLGPEAPPPRAAETLREVWA